MQDKSVSTGLLFLNIFSFNQEKKDRRKEGISILVSERVMAYNARVGACDGVRRPCRGV